jgi:hypothetical protein
MTGNFPPRANSTSRRGGLGLVGTSLVSATALIWATQAFADTTITSDRSTPINTSTVNNGQPDNVVVNNGVNLTPPGGAAITLDSNNTVTNNGAIKIQDQSNATGILVLGGHTGAVTHNGAITINETKAQPDTNGDGVPDGPFATGEGRFGIRVTGSQAFTGDIGVGTSGAITVQGNHSAGVSVEAPQVGNLSTVGTIAVTGDNSFGIRTLSTVSGNYTAGGSITATGQNSTAVLVGGNVGGAFVVNGSIAATGYEAPIRSTDATAVSKLLPSDLLQGGPAVAVQGSVGAGVLVDTTGVVASNGGSPGLQVGAVGQAITIGNVGSAAPDNFGVEVRGTVSGAGQYDHVSSTGVQIGVAGGGVVNTTGGVHNTGSMIATAAVADATALQIGQGAIVPLLQNDGTINGSVGNASGNTARGVQILAGANVPTLANSASIIAVTSGTSGDAIAVQDLSGTLTTLQNIRAISATLTSSSGPAATGRAIAIDVSANTSGFHLQQFDTSNGATLPSIVGSVLFGSGNDTADISAGAVLGDLAFGAGHNVLNIGSGAAVVGGLSATGGDVAVSLTGGTLSISSTNAVNLSSLTTTSGSTLAFTVDPKANAATQLNVSGAASLASGTKVGVHFVSLLTGSQTYTLVNASQLSVGTLDTSLLGAIPFLYTASVTPNTSAGTLNLTIAQKNAQQLGLSAAAAPALNPVLAVISGSTTLSSSFLAQTNQAGFDAAFDELLPSRSSAVFEMMAANAQEAGRAIDDRQGVGGGAWVQEINFGATDESRDGLPGYDAWGVGVMGGYEAAFSPQAIFGVSLGASSSQIRDLGHSDIGKQTLSLLDAGVYWRATAGHFSANARIGGDYGRVTQDRAIVIDNVIASTFSATASSKWNAMGVNARFRVAYESEFGSWYVRPQAGADYAQLHEDGYSESGAGPVNLTVDSRSSSRLSGFAGVGFGGVFGDEATWGPELLIGYRGVFNEDLGATTAHFTGGDPFTLASEKISGSGVAAHIGFKGENGYGGFAVQGGAETRGGLTIYDLRLTAHLQF